MIQFCFLKTNDRPTNEALKNMIRNFIFFPITLLTNKFLTDVVQTWGSALKYSHGTKFYVPDQYREIVNASMVEVLRFFGSEWKQYEGLIKSVVINDQLDSNFLPSHGFLIINESEQGKLATPEHLASWLVSYFRAVKVHKENHLGPIFWKNHIYDLAQVEGDTARREYLKSR